MFSTYVKTSAVRCVGIYLFTQIETYNIVNNTYEV